MSDHPKLNNLFSFFSKSRVVTIALLLLVFAASMICMIPFRNSHLARLEKIRTDDFAEEKFYAQCDFNFRDEEKCIRLKNEYEKKLEEIPDYYGIDDARTDAICSRIKTFYEEAVLSEKNGISVYSDLSPEDIQLITASSKEVFLADVASILRQGVLSDKIKSEILKNGNKKDSLLCIFFPSSGITYRAVNVKSVLSVSEAAGKIADLFRSPDGNKDERFYLRIEKIISEFIGNQGNLVEDSARRKQELAQLVAERKKKLAEIPLDSTYRRGDLLLDRGRVTKKGKDLIDCYCNALRAQQASSFSSVLRVWSKKFALALMTLAFTVIYIYHIHPEIRTDNRKIWILGSVAVLGILLNRTCLSLYDWLCSNTGMPFQLLVLMIPLAVPAALVSVIFGLRTSIFVVIYVSSITAISLNNVTQLVSGTSGIALDQSFAVLLSGLFTGAAAGYAVRTCSDYKKFVTRIFICTILVMLAIFITFLIGNFVSFENKELLKVAGSLILMNGLLTATVSLLFLMLLESFGVATNIYYYSLSNTNNRLLSQMQETANGTFHHSQNVSRIAGKAARKIKANVFRVKACAWYHDIGKLKKPAWFAENQTQRTGNPMENMTPEEAVECLRSHVSYGAELARKNKLPRTIIATILQHHGTDYVSYFYQKMEKKPADDTPYRYPGPIPVDKENVIIMFADAADAIYSSCPELTRDGLREKLETVLQKKIANGQLKEAQITLDEIYVVLDVLADELFGVKQDGSRETGAGYEDKNQEIKS